MEGFYWSLFCERGSIPAMCNCLILISLGQSRVRSCFQFYSNTAENTAGTPASFSCDNRLIKGESG